MSFMSVPAILQGYKDVLLTQKDVFLCRAQYPHYRFIVEELDNTNSIHAFNQLEEEGHIERFQCHSRLDDFARDPLYALGTPTIQD